MANNLFFKSLAQAHNYLKKLKGLIKRKASSDEFPELSKGPLTDATDSERRRYLLYGISLLNEMDYPTDKRGKIVTFKRLLRAEAIGYPIEWIAQQSGCPLKTVELWRKEAISHVQDAIHKRVKHGVPVIGLN